MKKKKKRNIKKFRVSLHINQDSATKGRNNLLLIATSIGKLGSDCKRTNTIQINLQCNLQYHCIYFVSFCRVPRMIENYHPARSSFYKTTTRLTREYPRPRPVYMYVVTSIFDKFHRYRSRLVRSSNSPVHREKGRERQRERDCSYKHDCVYSSRNRRVSSRVADALRRV